MEADNVRVTQGPVILHQVYYGRMSHVYFFI